MGVLELGYAKSNHPRGGGHLELRVHIFFCRGGGVKFCWVWFFFEMLVIMAPIKFPSHYTLKTKGAFEGAIQSYRAPLANLGFWDYRQKIGILGLHPFEIGIFGLEELP